MDQQRAATPTISSPRRWRSGRMYMSSSAFFSLQCAEREELFQHLVIVAEVHARDRLAVEHADERVECGEYDVSFSQ